MASEDQIPQESPGGFTRQGTGYKKGSKAQKQQYKRGQQPYQLPQRHRRKNGTETVSGQPLKRVGKQIDFSGAVSSESEGASSETTETGSRPEVRTPTRAFEPFTSSTPRTQYHTPCASNIEATRTFHSSGTLEKENSESSQLLERTRHQSLPQYSAMEQNDGNGVDITSPDQFPGLSPAPTAQDQTPPPHLSPQRDNEENDVAAALLPNNGTGAGAVLPTETPPPIPRMPPNLQPQNQMPGTSATDAPIGADGIDTGTHQHDHWQGHMPAPDRRGIDDFFGPLPQPPNLQGDAAATANGPANANGLANANGAGNANAVVNATGATNANGANNIPAPTHGQAVAWEFKIDANTKIGAAGLAAQRHWLSRPCC